MSELEDAMEGLDLDDLVHDDRLLVGTHVTDAVAGLLRLQLLELGEVLM